MVPIISTAPILWPPESKSPLIGKNPDAGKDWRQKEKGRQRMRRLDSITDSMDMSLHKLQETGEGRGAWHVAVHSVAKSWTWLCDWTTTKIIFYVIIKLKCALFDKWGMWTLFSLKDSKDLNRLKLKPSPSTWNQV